MNVIPERIFLPLGSVRLGRLTTSLARPHEDYHDAAVSAAVIGPTPYVFGADSNKSAGGRFGIALSSLLGLGLSKCNSTKVEVSLTKGNTYLLDNSAAYFDEVVGLDATRRWLEQRALRRRSVYVIVGIRTVIDAEVVTSALSGLAVDAEVTAPVDVAMASSGVVIPFAGLLNPKFELKGQYLQGGSTVLVACGEQICVLEYRELHYKWLSSRSATHARLGSTHQWLCLEGDTREMYDDEEDEEDMFEVDLADVANAEGMKVETTEEGILCMSTALV